MFMNEIYISGFEPEVFGSTPAQANTIINSGSSYTSDLLSILDPAPGCDLSQILAPAPTIKAGANRLRLRNADSPDYIHL